MPTDKPQFNCYVSNETLAAIKEHTRTSGQSKGSLVEQLWRLHQLQDLQLLYRLLAVKFTKPVTDKERSWAKQVVQLLEQVT